MQIFDLTDRPRKKINPHLEDYDRDHWVGVLQKRRDMEARIEPPKK